jgi:hypothetical protein
MDQDFDYYIKHANKINNLSEIDDDRYIFYLSSVIFYEKKTRDTESYNVNINIVSKDIIKDSVIYMDYVAQRGDMYWTTSVTTPEMLKLKFIKLPNGQYNIKIVNKKGVDDLYVASLISENNDGDFHNEWIYIKKKTGLDTSKWTINWNIEVFSNNPLIVQLTTNTKCMNFWRGNEVDLTVISKERCSANTENKIKFYILKTGDFNANTKILWKDKVKGNALFEISDSIKCSDEVADLHSCKIGDDTSDSGRGIGAIVGTNDHRVLVSTIKNYSELIGKKINFEKVTSSKTASDVGDKLYTVKCSDDSFLTGDTIIDPNQKFKGAICSKAQIKKDNNVILELKKIANSDINGWGECNKQNQLVTRMSIWNNREIAGMTCSEFTEVGPYIDFQNYIKTISNEYNTNKLVNNPAKLDELRNFCSRKAYNIDNDTYKKIGLEIQNLYKDNKYDNDDKYKDTCTDLVRYLQCKKRNLPSNCSQADIDKLEEQCTLLELTQNADYGIKDDCNTLTVNPQLEECRLYGISLDECSKSAIDSKINSLPLNILAEGVKVSKDTSKNQSTNFTKIKDILLQDITKVSNIPVVKKPVNAIITTSYMVIGLIITGVGIVLLGIIFLL